MSAWAFVSWTGVGGVEVGLWLGLLHRVGSGSSKPISWSQPSPVPGAPAALHAFPRALPFAQVSERAGPRLLWARSFSLALIAPQPLPRRAEAPTRFGSGLHERQQRWLGCWASVPGRGVRRLEPHLCRAALSFGKQEGGRELQSSDHRAFSEGS